ncbi:butyrophilin-like protein 2 isoform X1 [Sander vitreus]
MIFVSKRGPKCSAIVCPVFTVAPQPDINIIDATDDGVLLQCEVRGAAPKPRVEWQDRDGNKLPAKDPQVSERGDRYHITLQTTVTKTLSCSCVVTQEETNRRTHAEIYVAIIEPDPKVTVEQDSDVVLPCSLSTKENNEFKLFVWRKVAQKDEGLKEVFLYDSGSHYNNGLDGQSEEFKGRVSHFQDELKHGNASIIIRDTKISDSGNYTCYFPHLQPPQTFYIDLVVGEYFY